MSATPTTGSFTLSSDETTDHIEAVFFDEHDVEFSPPVPPHSLVVQSSDENTVTVTGQEPEEPWAFKLRGETTGSTSITVLLYHDDNVGATFKPVPVTVN